MLADSLVIELESLPLQANILGAPMNDFQHFVLRHSLLLHVAVKGCISCLPQSADILCAYVFHRSLKSQMSEQKRTLL